MAQRQVAPLGYRERQRRERRQEFLDVALGIVAAEGLAALTMARVTDSLQCATGLIYHYFPTKGALVAAVQLEALQLIGRSLQEAQTHLDELLSDRSATAAEESLARVVVAARFWISAEQTFPREIELCRRLFTEPGVHFADQDAEPVISPAFGLLDWAGALLDGAVREGALAPGSGVDRSIVLVAGSTGVLLTSELRRWDAELFEGQRLAQAMLADLLTAWGADASTLAFADEIASTLAERGQLVPLTTDVTIDLR
jgi:AcrR family transcriptional regulator